MADLTRILFVGDVELGGEFAGRYCGTAADRENPFSEVRPLFGQADLVVGNLESPLAKSSTPRPKRNLLHAPPEAVSFLDYLGFTSLCLANNHITDQGGEGIVKTRALLRRHGIECFGAGENIATASQAAFNRHGEQTFGFLGYAVAGEDVGAVIAGESEDGCAPFSIDNVKRDVAALRSRVSHVIVSLHWGYQFDLLPSPEQIETAREIIDAGAFVVHGHHPHVVQGVERYRNGLIMYSLGNFLFPNFKRTDGLRFSFPKISRQTVAVMSEVDDSGVKSFSVFPLRVASSYRVRPVKGLRCILDKKSLSSRSMALSTSNYERRWRDHHAKNRRARKRQERLLEARFRLKQLRNQLRAEGCAGILKKLRRRRLGEMAHALWTYVAPLLMHIIRR